MKVTLTYNDWQWEPEHNCVTRIDNGGCRVAVVEKIYGSSHEEWNRFGCMIALAPRMAEFVKYVVDYGKNCRDIYGSLDQYTDPWMINEAQAILGELRGEK